MTRQGGEVKAFNVEVPQLKPPLFPRQPRPSERFSFVLQTAAEGSRPQTLLRNGKLAENISEMSYEWSLCQGKSFPHTFPEGLEWQLHAGCASQHFLGYSRVKGNAL